MGGLGPGIMSSKPFSKLLSKMIKGRSSRALRKEFPHLKEWCGDHHLWDSSCYYDSVGAGREVDEKYIQAHNIYEHNRR